MNSATVCLRTLVAGAVALALGACTGPAGDAGVESSPTAPSPVATSVPEATPASSAVAMPEFPILPARDPVPLALGDVQGFYPYDSSDDDEQQVQSEVLRLWESWAAGTKVQRCMRAAGYDWTLEVNEGIQTGGPIVEVLQHFGKDITTEDTSDLPLIAALPNDAMLEQLGEARGSQALGALYGDFREGLGFVSEFYKDTLPDPDEAAGWSAEIYLTLPRGTGEGPLLFPFAGGCLGSAREAMPQFTVIPDEVSEAFAATFAVDPDLPIMVESREAFDACIRAVGIDFAVDPAEIEVIEVLDEDTVDQAYSDCLGPYRDVEGAVMQHARDQFVRDNEVFLSAREEAYDAQYLALEGDPGFMAYIDDVAGRLQSAG